MSVAPLSRERKVARVGKYFGKEPRYSREEAEAQAKQAIDALVSRGRPPADEWKGLAGRMGEINRELATRPAVNLPPPPPPRPTEPGSDGTQGRRRDISQLLRPRPVVEPGAAPAAEVPRAARAAPVKRAAPAKRTSRATAPAPAPAVKKAAKRSTATPSPAKAPAKRAAKKRTG